MTERPIFAIALLTREELSSLGPTFDRAWPVDETPCFGTLLQAIDEADRQIIRDREEIADLPSVGPAAAPGGGRY